MNRQIKQKLVAAVGSMFLGAVVFAGIPASRAVAGQVATPEAEPHVKTVNVNTASEDELQKLPGVNAEAAHKIVTSRPYKEAADLAKAGLDDKKIEKIKPHIIFEKIDINTASMKELEKLPTVGPVFAKKIMENRPYKTAGDLSKAGLTEKKIAEISPLVSFPGDVTPTVPSPVPAAPVPSPSPAPAPNTPAPVKPAPATPVPATPAPVKPAPATPAPAPAPMPVKPADKTGKIDLNTASVKELENIPGVTTADAFRIIANRPYKAPADLSKVGFNEKRIGEVTPTVNFDVPANAPSPATDLATETKALSVGHDKPAKGDVWVNTATGLYHKEGDPYYGKTKVGTYMTEAEAKKLGFDLTK